MRQRIVLLMNKQIEVGDWVEVVAAGDLPMGNRYKVKADYGKALELDGLDRLHSKAIFAKISGPDAPR